MQGSAAWVRGRIRGRGRIRSRIRVRTLRLIEQEGAARWDEGSGEKLGNCDQLSRPRLPGRIRVRVRKRWLLYTNS